MHHHTAAWVGTRANNVTTLAGANCDCLQLAHPSLRFFPLDSLVLFADQPAHEELQLAKLAPRLLCGTLILGLAALANEVGNRRKPTVGRATTFDALTRSAALTTPGVEPRAVGQRVLDTC